MEYERLAGAEGPLVERAGSAGAGGSATGPPVRYGRPTGAEGALAGRGGSAGAGGISVVPGRLPDV
ncbi:hypothetical protein [Streptomyces sp. NPDC002156]